MDEREKKFIETYIPSPRDTDLDNLTMSKLPSCANCNWCHIVVDSEGDTEYICANRFSDCFLQEVPMIKVNELFAGIGAFRKALQRLNIPHEIVGISEIDKYAIKSYEAIYGATRNYGDISKVAKLDYADLWTYGFPCQDISVAGRQAGIIKGETRSGLLYEVERLLTVAAEYNELPKYLILENVKNLVGKKFIKQFEEWIQWLDELGYNTYWQVINAKDCGIPQNRERVFAVSIRKDIDLGFSFSRPRTLQCSMFDFLEEEVEEKYYLSDAYIAYAEKLTERMSSNGSGIKFEPRERERRIIAKTITTKAGQRVTDNFIKEVVS